ncbi:hypothetical protein GKE82_12000 [Conexibacter sp. W3-3-2]|uniref:DbpA RNA binding domain-containing protein n=1 Tax=Conexibacter sp. W3-3-2 TaxID=2675227 RepID=UPI001323A52F|nr:hypothetical protein [Conexibacter sp. W3-3-2]
MTLLAALGTADGVDVPAVVKHVVKVTGLDGEVVQDVRVLTRFTLLKVPGAEVERVLAEIDGTELAGAPLRLQRARG